MTTTLVGFRVLVRSSYNNWFRAIITHSSSAGISNIHFWNYDKSQFQTTKPRILPQKDFDLRLWKSRSVRSMSNYTGKDKDYIFRQLLDYKSFTYTYLLADPSTNEAVLIDPVVDLAERDVKIIKDMDLNLKYAMNTHVHADHITGTGKIKRLIPTCKSVISQVSKAKADVMVENGDKVKFGNFELEVRSTPGHTNGCVTYVWHKTGMAFTGDALLVRGCGRTDFQEGDSSTLYDSVHTKILSLPGNFQLFPAHDYTGQTSTTVAEEKKLNPRLSKSKAEFIEIMQNLNLPYPKQIDKALPANMVCGVFDAPGEQK